MEFGTHETSVIPPAHSAGTYITHCVITDSVVLFFFDSSKHKFLDVLGKEYYSYKAIPNYDSFLCFGF